MRMKYAVAMYENNVDFIPEEITGIYDTPVIYGEEYAGDTMWISFQEAARRQYKRDEFGVHFFIDDYQFQKLWTGREKYRNVLPGFKAVMSPDFSIFTDWPEPVKLWNHYRKHLLGAWMQSIGCRVYPTISWADEDSYSWCFNGDPRKATVCVSSVGTQMNKESKRLFLAGYDKMLERLEPKTILFYGRIPDECRGNIVPIRAFQERLRMVKKHDPD